MRKKSFILTTLLAPLGFGLIFIVPILMISHDETPRHIAFINKSAFEINIQDSTSLYFKKEDTSLGYMKLVYKNLKYDGILYIPASTSLNSHDSIQYYSDNQLGLGGITHINQQLTKQITKLKIKSANLSEEVFSDLNNTNVIVQPIVLGEEGSTQVNTAVSSGIGYGMGFLIYMVMFLYGTMVMKGVAEEKTNRIIEIIISSVKPFQLMLGKIIGVGAVGLTQLLVWIILTSVTYFFLILVFSHELMSMQHLTTAPPTVTNMDERNLALAIESLRHLNWTAILTVFIFYFLGGYLLYGAMFAAVGSAVGEGDDNQSLNVIIAIPIILSMTLIGSVMKDPNSSVSIWASIIPLTSPIIMTARLPFHPPVWQILLSMLCLAGGVIFNIWMAGRIYRVGILMYGKKVTLKELGKWLFYK